MEEFVQEHPEQSTGENAFLEDYNKEFFEGRVIYAYVKSEGSGSNKLMVRGAELEGDKLTLIMTRTVPEIGTTDMAALVCLFEIKRSEIKDVKSIDYVIIEES